MQAIKIIDIMRHGPRITRPEKTAMDTAKLLKERDSGMLSIMPDSKQNAVNDMHTRQRALARWENEGGAPASVREKPSMKTPGTVRQYVIADQPEISEPV